MKLFNRGHIEEADCAIPQPFSMEDIANYFEEIGQERLYYLRERLEEILEDKNPNVMKLKIKLLIKEL